MKRHEQPGTRPVTGISDNGARFAAAGRAPSTAGDDAATMDGLRLRGIGKNFGPVMALTGVDLDIPAGQVTALVGDNGAGKSTLIKTISGIWEPSAGRMIWQSRRVHFRSPRDATHAGIATVYQDLALCDNLDIVENMLLGHEVRRHLLLDEVTMEKTAKQTLSDLRVTTVRNIRQLVGSLSGGQRQAVAVAKALVLDLIGRLARRGIAVIVVSHNLTDVFQVADRIAVLYLGRLVSVGPAADYNTASVVDLMTTGASQRTQGTDGPDRGSEG